MKCSMYGKILMSFCLCKALGPVVQSVVSLTSSLRVISVTVLADLIHNILIFIAEKNVSSFCIAKATHIFFSKKFQNICVSLDVNFNESFTNDIVSFEQLGLVSKLLSFGLILSFKIVFNFSEKKKWLLRLIYSITLSDVLHVWFVYLQSSLAMHFNSRIH